jgi:hypothetical protein
MCVLAVFPRFLLLTFFSPVTCSVHMLYYCFYFLFPNIICIRILFTYLPLLFLFSFLRVGVPCVV